MTFISRSLLALTLVAGATLSSAQVFGGATPYNVFTTGNFTSQGSDTEGKMAIGGDATLNGYAVALKDQGGDALIVGGDFHNTSGQAYGNVKYRGSEYTPNPYSFSATGVKGQTQNLGLDFAATTAQLQGLSSSWAGQSATGSVYKQWSTLHFQGSESGLNVFTVTVDQLADAGTFEYRLNIPMGASALINVVGTSATLRNIGYTNVDPTKLIWNFSQASTLSFQGSVMGSVLAIDADVSGTYGQLNGQFFGKSFNGPTQFNRFDYVGAAPVPEPASMAALAVGLAALRRRRARR